MRDALTWREMPVAAGIGDDRDDFDGRPDLSDQAGR
ncbi:hypothetical protein Pan14r_06760 [Crateriforma conspicua]|uniref:Uncharacterized protein n=1 Tax=Crateriforma conspicua TaxID=2527996 RepID=A0A5C5Y1C9_9PLAN|nr:hypothetical protein Mal65_19410 [Crateriforma conspicua]TWT68431.1 hypothetical protein Pan14r_06760 [Crateriforma conspicua]